jgi:hypothetical protein
LKGSDLKLEGDVANSTIITIFAPKSVRSVWWNSKKIHTISTKEGLLSAQVDGSRKFSLPKLNGWKYTDGLPEIGPEYTANSKAWISKPSTFPYKQ